MSKSKATKHRAMAEILGEDDLSFPPIGVPAEHKVKSAVVARISPLSLPAAGGGEDVRFADGREVVEEEEENELSGFGGIRGETPPVVVVIYTPAKDGVAEVEEVMRGRGRGRGRFVANRSSAQMGLTCGKSVDARNVLAEMPSPQRWARMGSGSMQWDPTLLRGEKGAVTEGERLAEEQRGEACGDDRERVVGLKQIQLEDRLSRSQREEDGAGCLMQVGDSCAKVWR